MHYLLNEWSIKWIIHFKDNASSVVNWSCYSYDFLHQFLLLPCCIFGLPVLLNISSNLSVPFPNLSLVYIFVSDFSGFLKLLSHHHKPHLLNRLLPPLTLTSSSSSSSAKSLIISSKVNAKSLVLQVSAKSLLALFTWVEARCCKVIDVSGVGGK